MQVTMVQRAGLMASATPRPMAARTSKVGILRPAGLVPAQVQLRAALPAIKASRKSLTVTAAAADAFAESTLDPAEKVAAKIFGVKNAPTVVTTLYIGMWYALNVAFNLQNKVIFNYFPYPWFVSTVHVVIGALYCAVVYLLGAKKASYERPITKAEFKAIFPPAAMHAIGHVAANLSFAAVAISLTHTVKTLEPAFNVILSRLVLGEATALPVMASLLPIMVGVAMASAAELSFNWYGFISAMISNLTFGFRAVWSKRAMNNMKNLGSTGIYAWTTLISVFICAPGIFVFEPQVFAAISDLIAAKGLVGFATPLLSVGILYHLYNQFAFNTLARVTPVSHGVCNVVKRICIIATSVLFFGNVLTTQTKIGTGIALAGTYLYTEAVKANKAKIARKAA